VGAGDDSQQTAPVDEADVGLDPSSQVIEGLVRMGPDFKLEPLLATGWQFRAPKTWRFKLRRGVRFHDGAPFTAASVKWTVERWMRTGRVNYLALGPGARVSVMDDYTVDIETVVPNRRLVESLADQRRGMIESGTYPGAGTSHASTPIGTGPFRFVQYFPGRELILAGFQGYWGGAPRISRLTIRYIEGVADRLKALQSGELDVALDLGPSQAATVAGSPDWKLLRTGPEAADLLLFNLQRPDAHPIVQDPGVRQAIAMAIDETAIVNRAWLGFGSAAPVLVPSDLARSSPADRLPYDPAKARATLDAAGWRPGFDGIRTRDGRRLTLQIALADLGERDVTATLLKSELQAVGVEAHVTTPDINHFFDVDLGGAAYDLAGLGFIGQRDANPLHALSYFSPAPGGCDFCIFGNAGADFDGRYARAVAAAHPDVVGLVRQALTIEAVAIVLSEKPELIGLSRRVQGFVAQPQDQRFDRAWLASG
jgi:peptide/nickel transport system substrate-binding protein